MRERERNQEGVMKQTDIYTEALICLRSILQTDHPEFKNWIDWLERDIAIHKVIGMKDILHPPVVAACSREHAAHQMIASVRDVYKRQVFF